MFYYTSSLFLSMENHKSIINEIFGLLNKASFMNGATGSVVECLWIKPASSSLYDYKETELVRLLSLEISLFSKTLKFQWSRLVTCRVCVSHNSSWTTIYFSLAHSKMYRPETVVTYLSSSYVMVTNHGFFFWCIRFWSRITGQVCDARDHEYQFN